MSVYLCWSRIGDGVCDLPESYLISSQLRKSSSNGEEHLITSRCESCTQLIRLLPRFVQSIGLIYLFLGTKSSLGMQNWRRWLPTQGSSPRRTTVTGRITRSNVFCMYSQTFIGWSWNSHHIFRIQFANRVPSRFFLCSRCCQLTNVELVLVIVNIDTRDFVVFIVSEILYNIFELCKEWTAESWIVLVPNTIQINISETHYWIYSQLDCLDDYRIIYQDYDIDNK